MTCIIALKQDGKVYMGGDRRISFNSKTKEAIDSDSPKILEKDNIIFGFAGARGIQNIAEMMWPQLKFNGMKLMEVSQICCNLLGLFKNIQAEILISDGTDIRRVVNNENYSATKLGNIECACVGVCADIVYGYLAATSDKLTIPEKIKGALTMVSSLRPDVVGGEFDIFPKESN